MLEHGSEELDQGELIEFMEYKLIPILQVTSRTHPYSQNTPFPRCTSSYNTVSLAPSTARLSGMYSFEMNLGRTSVSQERTAGLTIFFTVSVPVKGAATVLLPHVFATTRMERRSTRTKLLQRQLRHRYVFRRGICMGLWLLLRTSS